MLFVVIVARKRTVAGVATTLLVLARIKNKLFYKNSVKTLYKTFIFCYTIYEVKEGRQPEGVKNAQIRSVG